MTRHTSRTLANLLLGATGAAAGYLVLTNPGLRRVAVRVLKVGLATLIPGYLIRDAADAWRDAGKRAA